MDFVFGKSQTRMSRRLQKYPALGRMISHIFGYTNVGNFARADIFRRLLEQLPVHRFHRILDLGCGQGEYSFMLAGSLPGATVTALDIEPERLAAIENTSRRTKLKNLDTHCGKIETLANLENYDFIFSIDVFEHIAPEEMPFAAAFRQLRPGGFFLVKIPNHEQLTILPGKWFEDHHHWLDEEHIGQVYDLDGLCHRMKGEGFDIVHASYADGWWSRLGWELGYLSKKGGPLVQLLCLPVAKLLVHLDRRLHSGQGGNTIQVIGRKPVTRSLSSGH